MIPMGPLWGYSGILGFMTHLRDSFSGIWVNLGVFGPMWSQDLHCGFWEDPGGGHQMPLLTPPWRWAPLGASPF